jgi:hypothetical protein
MINNSYLNYKQILYHVKWHIKTIMNYEFGEMLQPISGYSAICIISTVTSSKRKFI